MNRDQEIAKGLDKDFPEDNIEPDYGMVIMKTKHYLLTRFNAVAFAKKRYIKDILNDDWLRIRLALFKKITVPSILNQTNQDFEWIVYCHPESPEWLIKELESIEKVRISFEYWYYNALDTDVDVLITSRVDSDDLLHRDYMQTIKDHTEKFIESGLEKQVYTFKHGVCYDINKDEIKHVSNSKGPFHTLFSKIKGLKRNCQVYFITHQAITAELPTFFNITKPGWMYIRHSNQVSGCDFVEREIKDPVDTLKEFGVDL